MTTLTLDTRNIALIEESFRQIEKLGEEVTATFYGQFLSKYPEVRETFSNVNMDRQHAKLFKALKLITESFRDTDSLAPYLQELGDKHLNTFMIQGQDFSMFKRALLDTFEGFLESDWTPEIHDAWSKAFDAIAAVMQQA